MWIVERPRSVWAAIFGARMKRRRIWGHGAPPVPAADVPVDCCEFAYIAAPHAGPGCGRAPLVAAHLLQRAGDARGAGGSDDGKLDSIQG